MRVKYVLRVLTILCIIGGLCISGFIGYTIISTMLHYKIGFSEASLVAFFAYDDRTQWAPHYSESKFLSIHTGMTADDIKGILGEPLEIKHVQDNIYWHYTVGPNGKSQSNADGSTHVRGIGFNEKMIVVNKLKYFYVD